MSQRKQQNKSAQPKQNNNQIQKSGRGGAVGAKQKRSPKQGPALPPGHRRSGGERKTKNAVPMHRLTLPKGTRYVGFGDYREKGANRSQEPRRKEKMGTGWLEDWMPLLKLAAHLGTSIAGFGDYEVKSNSIMAAHSGGTIGGDVPVIDNGGNSNITRHREFIGPVMGSTTPFAVTRYPLQPGLRDVFPWYNTQANCWTRAKWRGAIVEYIPLSSDYSATSALGSVMLGTQYNVLEPPYINERELLNGEYSQVKKPCEAFIHPIECAPSQMAIDEYYIRAGPPPENADLRLYDLGVLSVATGGNLTNGKLGDLYITYEMELFQPKLNEDAGAHADNFSFTANEENPLGLTETRLQAGNLGGKIVGNKYYFPTNYTGGKFLWTYYVHSEVAAALAGYGATFFAPFVNCTALTAIVTPAGLSTGEFLAWGIVQITGPTPHMELNTSMTLPWGVGNFIVSALPDSFDAPIVTLADVERPIPRDNGNTVPDTQEVEFDPADLQKFLRFMKALEDTKVF
jgi:hypothetical protein